MPDQPPPKTFLLGLGCMKGGTTWLNRYLSGSPQCAPGPRKEYHIFDSVDLAEPPYAFGRIVENARAEADSLRTDQPGSGAHLLQLAMMADDTFYFDYFTGLLNRSPQVRLTMDISPGYALLGAGRLARIKDGFERRGIRVAPVFIMRDPVDRVLSHLGMQRRRRPNAHQGTLEDLVLRRHAEPTYALRSEYAPTVRHLDQVFADASSFHFYERLYDAGELAGVCDFAGIDYLEPDLDTRYNASTTPEQTLSEDTARLVAQHFASTYRFVSERFTGLCGGDLRSVWPNARHVL